MKEMRKKRDEKKLIKRKNRRYSYGLKRKIVYEIMRGILTKEEALIKYEIKNRQSINGWIRKYGTLNYRTEKEYGMKQSPEEKIKELQSRIEELETDKEILNIAIDIADDQLKTEIRKKYLPQQLKKYKGKKCGKGKSK